MTAHTSIEDRLRRALSLEAGAVDVGAPAALAATAVGRRSRPGFVVAALAAVTVLALAVVARDDGGNRLQVTSSTGRLYLAPTNVEGFRLIDVATDPKPDPDQGTLVARRFFARPSADGTTVTATVAVVVLEADRLTSGDGREEIVVEGEPVDVQRGPDDNTMLLWEEDSGLSVHVAAYGLGDSDLVDLAASLRPGPAASATPDLPAGVVPLPATVQLPPDDAPRSTQQWINASGDSFTLAIGEHASLDTEALRWSFPAARPTTVRGHEGRVSGGELRRLAWLERPGALVTLDSNSLTVADLGTIAVGLRSLDEAQWEALAATEETDLALRKRGRATIIAAGEREGSPWEALVYGLEERVVPAVCLEVGGQDICYQATGVSRSGMSALLASGGFITGVTAADVDRVEARLPDGRVLDVEPLGVDLELSLSIGFIVIPLPADLASATVVAFDGEGRELGRQDVGPRTPRR